MMDGEGGNLLLDLTKALLVRVGNGVKLLRVFLDQLRINPGGEKDMVWFVSYRGFLPTFGDVLRGLVHYVHLSRGDTHCQP